VLAVQASFNLGHQVSGKAQVLQSLLYDLGSVLRLAAITLKALLGFEVATLFGFRVFFDVSCSGGYGVLLGAVGGVGGCRLSKRMFYENSVTSASRVSNISAFLLSPICGIHASERFCPCSSRLLHASGHMFGRPAPNPLAKTVA
jgi:hypothetical protein